MIREATNKDLAKAALKRDDEFYTTLENAAKMMSLFKNELSGKSLFLNCDNPKISKIFEFFCRNFADYKLKKVVAVGYGGDYAIVENGTTVLSGKLKGNGSFDSEESKQYINDCDVIVTNPPFSNGLFRDFLQLCISSGKDFLCIGPITATATVDVIKLLASNNVNVGKSVFENFVKPDDSSKRVGNLIFTTFEHVPKQKLKMQEEYSEEKYPYSEKYDCIIINSIKDIPRNYHGRLAVPVSIFKFGYEKYFQLTGELAKNIVIDGQRKFTKVIIKTI